MMTQIKKAYTFYNFPKWALSALINDDFSGLEDDSVDMFNDFMVQFDDVIHWDYDSDSLNNGNFMNYPLFGLASDCCTIHGYVKK